MMDVATFLIGFMTGAICMFLFGVALVLHVRSRGARPKAQQDWSRHAR